MNDSKLYQDLARRTGGAFLIGVVGPVRTGKSTFIKRFMETLVLPGIENDFVRERAKDELPQSGSGRTIMTAEPKFVPEEAVSLELEGCAPVQVRLADCVGYMVDGAAGQFEDGRERLVTTPWFDHEVSMSEAAEKGTWQVITEHSTLGVVITTDGSICDIPRAAYVPAEDRVIRELKEIGKPFVVLLNCADPDSESALQAAEEIRKKHRLDCLRVNCLTLEESQIALILRQVLMEFPLNTVCVRLPSWMDALDPEEPVKAELFAALRQALRGADRLKDGSQLPDRLLEGDSPIQAEIAAADLGRGDLDLRLRLPEDLYYQVISEKTGLHISDQRELMETLSDLSAIRTDYERIRGALEQLRSGGYGLVLPEAGEMVLEEPQIVRQGGKYTVRLKATAPAIHMMMTQVETEVSPAIGGNGASEEILSFLLQGFDGDMNRIWESNIFGRSLNEIAQEGLGAKLEAMPENVKSKLRLTAQRIVNDGCSNLFCILI